MSIYPKPVRKLMREMVEEIARQPDESFTKQEAIKWFGKQYPKIKTGTISCHLIRLSTNALGRVHYNPRPEEDDLLFQIESGQYRLYDPKSDPSPIRKSDNGDLPIDDLPEKEGFTEFAYERDLREYLARNISLLDPGMKLYEEDEISGIEFPVGGRFIDILAVDSDDDFVVIELKVSRAYDRVVGQLMRYMAWIKDNQAESGQKVRGIIVARKISEDLSLACSLLENVKLFDYELSVLLKRVNIVTCGSRRSGCS